MKTEEMDVIEVIFRMPGKNLIFRSPSVTAMNIMGQETYQVIGESEEMKPEETGEGVEGAEGGVPVETGPAIPREDIKLVAERAGVSEAEAREALIKTDGDIAEAIIMLMG